MGDDNVVPFERQPILPQEVRCSCGKTSVRATSGVTLSLQCSHCKDSISSDGSRTTHRWRPGK